MSKCNICSRHSPKYRVEYCLNCGYVERGEDDKPQSWFYVTGYNVYKVQYQMTGRAGSTVRDEEPRG